MADKKYLDPGGVTYLWGKIKALMGISGGSEGFENVLDILEDACSGLLEALLSR